MAKQTIGIGSVPNDGNGDTIRDALDKVNDNFDEVYSAFTFSSNNASLANTLIVGNTTVNVAVNSTSFSVANSTSNISLSSGSLSLGNSTVNVVANSSTLIIGNYSVNAVSYKFGNTTVNSIANSTTLKISNSTSSFTANIGILNIGNSTINAVSNSSSLKVSNSTSSVTVSLGSIDVGNSTVNATVNSSSLTVTSANLTTNTGLTLGSSTDSANGYTYLPNGFKINWGWVSANNTDGNAQFSSVFTTNAYSVTATSNTADATFQAAVIAVNNSIASIRTANATSTNVFWMAIGK